MQNWTKKRKRCWTLPKSVFEPAIAFDDWFRKTVRKFVYMDLRNSETILIDGTCGTSRERCLKEENQVIHLGTPDRWFGWNELDLVFAGERYNGWEWLPYDMNRIWKKIARIQVSVFCRHHVSPDVQRRIAEFALDGFEETEDEEDEEETREFMIDWEWPVKRKTRDKLGEIQVWEELA